MKKIIIFLIFFLLLFNINFNYEDTPVMSSKDIFNDYVLTFTNDKLNFANIKLKLALFSNHESYIKRVYIKYNNKVRDYFYRKYFSFDSMDFSTGILKLKEQYNLVLQKNYLYDELDKGIAEVEINKVVVSTNHEILNKFVDKYPDVIISKMEK